MAELTEDNPILNNKQVTENGRLYADMVNYIVNENKAYFRSQQINDPDITADERRSIVEELLEESHKKFLARFGDFIKAEHLEYFENFEYTESVKDADGYEIQHFLQKIRRNLANHDRDVKNRRFAAMQKLLDENDGYFSEVEMMKREPLLYEQWVGQYMTDNERKVRDAVMGAEDSRFSSVLLHDVVMKRIEELRKQQQVEEEKLENEMDEENESSSDSNSQSKSVHKDGIINDTYYPQIPPSFKQHWGDFEDDNNTKATTSGSGKRKNAAESQASKKNKIEQRYVSAEEKDLLRDEFYEVMCTNFLEGKDEEFDYSAVDDNTDYDNLDIQAQDAEEKYFDADDDDEESRNGNDVVNDSDDDDELDVYMKELNKNN